MTDPDVRYSYGPSVLDQLSKHSNGKAYRKKIEPCPYCEPKCGMFEKPKFATEWSEEGIVREIVFIREVGLYWKKGYAMMVSACPRCRKLSFHHRDIEWLLRDDWANEEIVQAEIDAWEQQSIDTWENSLCNRCTVDRKVEENKFGYTLECSEGGSNFPEDPWGIDTFRCKKFDPVDPDLCVYCGKKTGDDEQVHKECQEKMDEINRVSYNEWLRRMHELGSYLDRKEKKKGESLDET